MKTDKAEFEHSTTVQTSKQKSRVQTEREQLLGAYRNHLSLGMARLAELSNAGVEAHSEGPHIWDEEGKRYLDCGGYGVFILGHCHPRIVDKVVEQVRTNPTSTYVLLNRIEIEAAEALVGISPPGLDHVYFGLSGAEAVETAIKLGRLNDKRRIIAMENGFHGMTMGALSVTGRELYRRPFQPLLPDVEFIPFGNADALAEALQHGPDASVILEPVQGEGGVIIPPVGYLGQVEVLCRQHNAFLILDEIQTGLGRLGAWWGMDREDVKPDLLLVGKGLSGGVVPVSAVVGSADSFRKISRDPLLHTSTFSGAPIAMAAAKATIEVIQEEGIVERAAHLGERLLALVTRAIAETCPSLVREVRGVGLLIAIEWHSDFLALDFLIEMLDRSVIIVLSSNAPHVTRLTPPAILSEEDILVLDATIRASGAALAQR